MAHPSSLADSAFWTHTARLTDRFHAALTAYQLLAASDPDAPEAVVAQIRAAILADEVYGQWCAVSGQFVELGFTHRERLLAAEGLAP